MSRLFSAPELAYALVRDLTVERFPTRLTCGVLGRSTQAFNAWLKDRDLLRDLEDPDAVNSLIDAHDLDLAFRYPFLTDELKLAGTEIGERRAWRLCSEESCSPRS